MFGCLELEKNGSNDSIKALFFNIKREMCCEISSLDIKRDETIDDDDDDAEDEHWELFEIDDEDDVVHVVAVWMMEDETVEITDWWWGWIFDCSCADFQCVEDGKEEKVEEEDGGGGDGGDRT